MKKRLVTLIILGVVMFLFSGCIVYRGNSTCFGDGKIAAKEELLSAADYHLIVRDIQFSASKQDRAFIVIDEALEDKLALTTDQNILDTISISVDAKKRIIEVKGKKGERYDFSSFKIEMGCPVRALQIDGGYSVDLDLPSITDFAAVINGAIAGDFTFDRLNTFSIMINGASDIKLTGECAKSTAVVNGASNIRAYDFITEDSSIELSGASNYQVYVTGTLDGIIQGIGAITYTGSPQAINRKIGGLGVIKEKDS